MRQQSLGSTAKKRPMSSLATGADVENFLQASCAPFPPCLKPQLCRAENPDSPQRLQRNYMVDLDKAPLDCTWDMCWGLIIPGLVAPVKSWRNN